jgi:hypothetical protein
VGKRYEIRTIKRKPHKLCRGPLHATGGEWLPTTNFRKRSDGSGRLRGSCAACEHLFRYGKPPEQHSAVGWLDFSQYRFAVLELEARLGRAEARRRVGVGKTTWLRWSNGATRIQKAKALKLIQTLIEVRRNKEARHKHSIRRGSAARGEPEKVPRKARDFHTIPLMKKLERLERELENELAA